MGEEIKKRNLHISVGISYNHYQRQTKSLTLFINKSAFDGNYKKKTIETSLAVIWVITDCYPSSKLGGTLHDDQVTVCEGD